MKGWKCWLTQGVLRGLWFLPRCSCGLSRPDTMGTGSFYWDWKQSSGMSFSHELLPCPLSTVLHLRWSYCLSGSAWVFTSWQWNGGTEVEWSQQLPKGAAPWWVLLGNPESSVAPVLIRFGLFRNLMNCPSRREGNGWIWITQYLPSHKTMCKLLFHRRLRRCPFHTCWRHKVSELGLGHPSGTRVPC